MNPPPAGCQLRPRVMVVGIGYIDAGRMDLLNLMATRADITLLMPSTINSPAHGVRERPHSTPQVAVASLPTWSTPFGEHFIVKPITRSIRRFKPSVVHVEFEPWMPEFWTVVVQVLLAAPRAKIVVYAKKNTRKIPRGPSGWLERLLTWLGWKVIDKAIVSSEMTRTLFITLGCPPNRISVQAHVPVDPLVFTAVSRDTSTNTCVVGYVGSVSEHKGVLDLVEAVAEVRRRSQDNRITLTLAGPIRDDHIRAYLNKLAWVTCLGLVENDEVPHILKGVDIFVMPSRILPDHQEHDAQALLEAMTAGRACIGSNSGVIPEILTDGINGLTFAAESVDQLVGQVDRLRRDSALRLKLGDQARRDAQVRVSPTGLATQRMRIYREVIDA